MKVYVVTEEPYHDNGQPVGVYATLKAAEASRKLEWEHGGFYAENWTNPQSRVVSEATHAGGGYDSVLIYEFEVQR